MTGWSQAQVLRRLGKPADWVPPTAEEAEAAFEAAINLLRAPTKSEYSEVYPVGRRWQAKPYVKPGSQRSAGYFSSPWQAALRVFMIKIDRLRAAASLAQEGHEQAWPGQEASASPAVPYQQRRCSSHCSSWIFTSSDRGSFGGRGRDLRMHEYVLGVAMRTGRERLVPSTCKNRRLCGHTFVSICKSM